MKLRKWFAAALLVVAPVVVAPVVVVPFVNAASSTSIGASDAQRCYEESRLPLSMQGVDYCTEAIRSREMTRRDLAATYSNRGIILAANGRYQDALDDHNEALSIVPDLAQAFVNRGNVFYHLRDFEAALEDFDRAIELGARPTHIPWYNRGITLLKMQRKEDAADAFRRGLEIAPDSRKLRDRLADLEAY